MATKQVNIDIIAKDKTRMAMRSAQQGIDRVKNAVFNLRNAFLGIGAGLVAKSFLDTAREVERLQVRFKFLFDEAKEGEQAFKNLIRFASEVPFTLDEIQRGSANLAVVSKDAKELNTLLKITGDIASASGLDFQTTAEQIQRTFSGGINSADLFRERGVRALLGFEAGVAISAEQSRDHILRAFNEGTLSVVGASDQMAKTFDGTLSMVSDKFIRFKIAVMDSAPFDFLKKMAMVLEQSLEKNFGSIEEAGKKFGKNLVEAFKSLLMGGATVLDFLTPMFSFLQKSIGNLLKIIESVPPAVASLGIIGFLLLGRKGKAMVLIIGAFIDEIRMKVGQLMESIADFQLFMNQFKIKSFLQSQEEIDAQKKSFEDMKKRAQEMQKPITDASEKFKDLGDSSENTNIVIQAGLNDSFKIGTKFRDMVKGLLNDMKTVGEKTKEVFSSAFVDVGLGDDDFFQNVKKINEKMSGSELLEQDPKINALKQIADVELKVAQDTAVKRLEIAKQTALKEKQIRETFLRENLGIMRAGNFQELNMEKMTKEQRSDLVKASLRDTLDQMAQHNKTAFKINKAFNLAQAIQNTASGITKALALGPIGVPLAVAIGAMGAVQIASIANSKYQGRRLGGRVQKGEPYMVGEGGAEMIVPDSPGTVIPNNKISSMQQPVNVNFNINTVDARGFNELLVNSRGVIVNMINQAVNEKGKMAIV